MNLLSPVMLLGVLFAAVPLVIHLLNRSRYKIEPFGAMIFLQAAVRERAQSIKLRQIVLLLMRMMLFMLLALALSRPVSDSGRAVAAVMPTTHVIVIDGSYSMQQTADGTSVFEKAVAHASAIVDDMAAHDNGLLIWAGNNPRLLQPSPTFDKVLLRRSLDKLTPGTESSNLPGAIRQGLWALAGSNLPVHRLYVITDGQQHAWNLDADTAWSQLQQHRQSLTIPPQIYVVELGAGEPITNVAPVSINSRLPLVDTLRRSIFDVELANYSDRGRAVRLQVSVDGEDRHVGQLNLAPGRTTHSFDHLFTRSGDHALSVRVIDDDLAVDNVFHKVITVQDTIPILLVEGAPSRDPFDSSGGLIKLALEAAAEPDEESLFEVTTISHLDVNRLDLPSLREYRCLILANVPSVSQRFAFQLEQYAESGGGVLFTLGDRVTAAAYTPLVKAGTGLLPASLQNVIEIPPGANPTFAAGVGSVILANFDLSRTRVIKTAKVLRQWLCTPRENSISLSTINDNPLLIYRDYGRGRVALWTSALSVDWTNFPVTPDFLPFIHDLVAYLAATPSPSINLAQGTPLVCTLSDSTSPTTADVASRTAILTTPDESREQLPLMPVGNELVARWQDTVTPGIYRIEASGQPARLFSVMPPIAESNLAAYTADERHRLMESLGASLVHDAATLKLKIAEESGVREWWRWLIFGALGLLCLELLAGRIFS